MTKFRLCWYSYKHPPELLAIAEGLGRETKTQVIINAARVVWRKNPEVISPIWGAVKPVRYSKKTGRPVGSHFMNHVWMIARAV